MKKKKKRKAVVHTEKLQDEGEGEYYLLLNKKLHLPTDYLRGLKSRSLFSLIRFIYTDIYIYIYMLYIDV